MTLTALLTLVGLGGFEAIQHLTFPGLKPWQSGVLTAVCGAALATVAVALAGKFHEGASRRREVARLAEINAELNSRDDRLRGAFLEAPFPVMIHAEDGEVIQLNRAWTTLTGYTHQDLPTVDAWTRRAYGQEHAAAMRALIEDRHAIDHAAQGGEHTVTTATGDTRTWDFASAPLGALPDGRRLVILTARDITDRRRAEEGMRAAETRLRRIAAQAPGAVYQFLVQPDGFQSFPFVSDGARELCGLEPAQVEADANALISRIHPEDFPSFQQAVHESLITLQSQVWEGRFVFAGGGVKWIKTVARPERQANGGTLWDGIALDVTGEKLTEELLRLAKGEAERANAAKSGFLSRMSHELRTPLNAILGFGQLLELDTHSESQRESVEQILHGGRHLLALIDEVLDISRIETGQLALSLQEVELAEALRGAADLVRPLAVQRNVRLNLSPLEKCAEWQVRADPQRLRQILLNLLANAVKYNRPGGEVEVSCAGCWPAAETGDGNRDERTRVEVRDTGSGLTDEQVEKLFQPFERLGAERGVIEGTGLGLALCKGLVEAMGGSIGAQSTPGQGSTFWIELPAGEGGEPRSTGAVSPPVPPERIREPGNAPADAARNERGTIQVLYVEDKESNLYLVERLMARRLPEIQLRSVDCGERALAAIRRERPDLILLDLHLPDMTGEEVLRRLRVEMPGAGDIPVVILSADATAASVARLLAAGAHAYLTKPLDIERFCAVLTDALGEKG